MPTLRRAGEAELERLRQIFLKAETDIINEIGRLRSMGNVDYHAVAARRMIVAAEARDALKAPMRVTGEVDVHADTSFV